MATWSKFSAALWSPLGLVLLFAAAMFFCALGEAPYWDRDEPRNAGCAAEMMARGDLIVPTFNDQIRTQKPVLLYWLMMAAYQVFGVNEFAGRFFSALAGLGTCVLTWHIARAFFDRTTALIAALALCSNVMFCVAARAATPDSILIFFATAALAFFVSAWKQQSLNTADGDWKSPFESQKCFWGVYSMLGLAVLAKGPIGFILPMAMMGWFLLQERDDHAMGRSQTPAGFLSALARPFVPNNFVNVLRSMRPLAGGCIVLAISAPWFLLVAMQTDGVFTSMFFLKENFGRAAQAFEGHGGGLWYYPLAILVGFFPWSLFWGPVVAALCLSRFGKQKQKLPAGIRFALVWVTIQVVAFSIASTKLPSYVTPCYPALALLTACVLRARLQPATASAALRLPTPAWLWKVATVSWIASGLCLGIGLVVAARHFPEIPLACALLGMIPLISGLICLKSLAQRPDHYLACFVGGACVLCFSMFSFLAAGIGGQNEFPFAKFLRDRPSANVATFDCLESSWVYYSGHPIVELRTDDQQDSGALQRLSNRPFWQTKERLSVGQFAATDGKNFVVTTESSLDRLKEKLPGDTKVVQTAAWFLKNKKLVLLEIGSPATAQNPSRSTSRR